MVATSKVESSDSSSQTSRVLQASTWRTVISVAWDLGNFNVPNTRGSGTGSEGKIKGDGIRGQGAHVDVDMLASVVTTNGRNLLSRIGLEKSYF